MSRARGITASVMHKHCFVKCLHFARRAIAHDPGDGELGSNTEGVEAVIGTGVVVALALMCEWVGSDIESLEEVNGGAAFGHLEPTGTGNRDRRISRDDGGDVAVGVLPSGV